MKTKSLVAPFEFKTTAEDGAFSGYGSVFGVRDSYGDVVEPGAFQASLEQWKAKGKLPRMLWQHRMGEPIGVWTRMAEDSKGLHVEGRLLLDVQRAREAHALMKAGAVDGLSIGYVPVVEGWDKESQTNRLKQIDLWEVSPVTFPANPEAMVEQMKGISTIRELEQHLRDGGLSIAAAKKIAAGGWKALDQRDADEDAEAVKHLIAENIRAFRAGE